jgi:transcription initiation factor TFIID TATA-box-binding protein
MAAAAGAAAGQRPDPLLALVVHGAPDDGNSLFHCVARKLGASKAHAHVLRERVVNRATALFGKKPTIKNGGWLNYLDGSGLTFTKWCSVMRTGPTATRRAQMPDKLMLHHLAALINHRLYVITVDKNNKVFINVYGQHHSNAMYLHQVVSWSYWNFHLITDGQDKVKALADKLSIEGTIGKDARIGTTDWTNGRILRTEREGRRFRVYPEADTPVAEALADGTARAATTTESKPEGVPVDPLWNNETNAPFRADQHLGSGRKAQHLRFRDTDFEAGVVNVVATTKVTKPDKVLDLISLAQGARNIKYEPKRFPAAVIRIREPKATALLFAKGKMVVVGCKSEDNIRLARRKFFSIIKKLLGAEDLDLRNDIKIHNVVVACSLKRYGIKLAQLSADRVHGQWCSYEPETFPAAIYKVSTPKCAVLIFHTGKFNVTGLKTVADFDLVIPAILELVCKYRRVWVGKKK